LSKIIARDFFPSLAHLEATNTFLSSLDSQDPDKIQESVRRLSDLRATPQHRISAPATPYGRTPYDTPLRTPRAESSLHTTSSRPAVNLSLSLDAFQAKYTSEDNSSFTEVLDDENQQRRQKYAWAWDAERRTAEKKAKEIEGRERLLLEAAGESSRERLMVEGRTVALIEAPKSKSLSNDDDETGLEDSVAKDGAGTLVLSEASGAAEEAGEAVDVMAPRKDTRSAAVPGWRFKVMDSLYNVDPSLI
jgi:protein DGCR14